MVPVRRRQLIVRTESWPIAGRFTISRGSKTAADVVIAEIHEDGRIGRGECVPYPHYGESIEGSIATIESIRSEIEAGIGRDALRSALPPGASRNAVDCALWDLEAKRTGRTAWQLAGLAPPRPVVTAYTLSVDTPENLATAARANAARPLLKLKLGGEGDLERVRAVREGAPQARLIVDANEAWTARLYAELAPELSRLGVDLIEQPLPAGADADLAGLARPVPVCADESCHDTDGLAALGGKYDAINVKLDKTGGLTEALRLVAAARAAELRIMVGCMVSTSLSMAPAMLVAQGAEWVDLDGPLLLARDRDHGLVYQGSLVEPPSPALWG
jgi:L-alanine-DL-glutamate epimerase-like enolase superfamily enzyme